MKRPLIATAAAVLTILCARPAAAHHVVWLDFSGWNLSAWGSVNGNNPPTAADQSAVRELIIANMVEDFAQFDVYFTEVQPPNGRYTQVIFYAAADPSGGFGCAGASCCSFGSCTGIGSWTNAVSQLEVYTGSFATSGSFTGTNATTARIANGISGTASHELGHVLGLRHCHSGDDFVTDGAACSDGYAATDDANVNWHIMASGASTGLSMSQRATRDRFFSIHASRRVLFDRLQPRNHWLTLGNNNGALGRSDLTYGRLMSPSVVRWYNRLSTGSSFGAYSTWTNDGGQRADLFMSADVTGDGRADLVFGRILNAATVRWFVKVSSGSSYGATTQWVSDAGDAGDVFRLADVNNDGRADLVYGRPFSSSTVTWYVRLSTGSSFGGFTEWASDAGNRSDLFLVGDVTGDGRADLVAVDRGDGVRVYRSTGGAFAFEGDDSFFTFSPEYVMLGDADGDGRADLITGEVRSQTDVDWNVFESNGCGGFVLSCFNNADEWVDGAGDAGDLFRLGDGNGDGRVDLFYARAVGMTSLTSTPDPAVLRWFGRLSTGIGFGSFTTWASDAGDEGDIIP